MTFKEKSPIPQPSHPSQQYFIHPAISPTQQFLPTLQVFTHPKTFYPSHTQQFHSCIPQINPLVIEEFPETQSVHFNP